jgi:hypothetical protein
MASMYNIPSCEQEVMAEPGVVHRTEAELRAEMMARMRAEMEQQIRAEMEQKIRAEMMEQKAEAAHGKQVSTKEHQRDTVLTSYQAAKADNAERFRNGDVNATEEYIFPNQKLDAHQIVDLFYSNDRRAVSVMKKTKVGADGLMIEIAMRMTTHSDDQFMVNHKNVRIITGMSNKKWEEDMIAKAPGCFKCNIFHHGKLTKADLRGMRDSLIIIDEIDTGDKEDQRLHTVLKEAGILDVKHMAEMNNRLVFISATMILELAELDKWGDHHESYLMTIPPSYIGHAEFLAKGLIQEFYPLNKPEYVEKWLQEDILQRYNDDYRVHFVRSNRKTASVIEAGCVKNHIRFMNHTSTDRISKEEEDRLYEESLSQHVVVAVKGFMRRANLIPNARKLRIGAMHELHTEEVDNNVQIQGFPGRMSGYWKDAIEGGHLTGPFRTSVRAIKEYDQAYRNLSSIQAYRSARGKIVNGQTKMGIASFLSRKHVRNLGEEEEEEVVREKGSLPVQVITLTEAEMVLFIPTTFNAEKAKRHLKTHHTEFYLPFATYDFRMWRANTPSKVAKWRINALLEPGAYSTTTNIHEEIRHTNVVMVYLYENKLIMSPWNGANYLASAASAASSASALNSFSLSPVKRSGLPLSKIAKKVAEKK